MWFLWSQTQLQIVPKSLKKFPIVARLKMLKSSFEPRDHWLVRLQDTGKIDILVFYEEEIRYDQITPIIALF